MTIAIINPGSGDVRGGRLLQAYANMRVLIKDAGLEGWATFRRDFYRGKRLVDDGDDGRWAFIVKIEAYEKYKARKHSVLMPGIPIKKVRWMNRWNQSCLDYPRLYVDGNSWYWFFAIQLLQDDDERS